MKKIIGDEGTVYTKEEFLELIEEGTLTSDDGSASYSDGSYYFDKPSINIDHIDSIKDLDSKYSHIIWFNV